MESEAPAKVVDQEEEEGSDAAVETEPAEEDKEDDPSLAGLSKKQRKKAERRKRMVEFRKVKRAEKKQEMKAASAARKLEKKRQLEAMPEDELEAYRERVRAERGKKRKTMEDQRDRLKQAMIDGVKIVLDFDWNDHPVVGSLSTEKEIKSLVFQLQRAYAVNSRSVAPAGLVLAGISEKYKPYFEKVSGIENWKGVVRHEEPYEQVFADRKDDLVYLTADAETSLEHIDEKSIYVIGGIVDRNRFKNVTLDKAADQGIRTASLPITSYVKLKTSHVLTVNQMVEIFVSYLEAKHDGKSVDECWKHAFHTVIPQRKREGEQEGSDAPKVAKDAKENARGKSKEEEQN